MEACFAFIFCPQIRISDFSLLSFERPVAVWELHQFHLGLNAFGKPNKHLEWVADPRQQVAFARVVLRRTEHGIEKGAAISLPEP